MKRDQLLNAIGLVDDELVERAAQVPERRAAVRWRRWCAAAVCAALVVATGVTVYAVSPDFRELLAGMLGIGVEETQGIGVSARDQGIVMRVDSAYLSGDCAVVLVTFEKEDGTPFEEDMAPDLSLEDAQGNPVVPSGFGGAVSGARSKDNKTLLCYYTWKFPQDSIGRDVVLNVQALHSGRSQLPGEAPPESIYGDWSVRFTLQESLGNTQMIQNPNRKTTVNMCGKELQVDRISLSGMLLVAETTVRKEEEIPTDYLSSLSPYTGAYYNVWVQLVYRDGSESEPMECMLDSDSNIVAWNMEEPFEAENLREIRIGPLAVPVETEN